MTAAILTPSGSTMRVRLKDALQVAVIALLLGIPMIGLTTVDVANALQVQTRWGLLAGFVLAVFVGRLLLLPTLEQLRARGARRAARRAEERAAARAAQRPMAGWPLERWLGLAG